MANEIQATTAATNTVAPKSKKEAKKALKQQAKTIYQQAAELSTSTSELDVRNDVKNTLKDDYKNKKGVFEGLSDKEAKDLYHAIKKEGGFGFFRRNFVGQKKDAWNATVNTANKNKEELDQVSENFYLKAMGDSDATTEKGVRKDVRSTISSASDADLVGDSKFSADQVRKNAMRQTSKGTWVRQFNEWTGDVAKKDATTDFKTQAAINRVAQTKEGIISGSKHLSAESQAVLDNMGLSYEDIYRIGDEQFGSDATDNYSNKRKQRGENIAIMGTLSNAAKAAGKEFNATPDQVETLYRELGYDIEPKSFTGHIVGGAMKGAGIGAGSLAMKVSQSQIVKGITGVVNQSQKVIHPAWAIIPATTVIGAGLAYNKDVKRVENRIADKEVPENITTYEEYANFMDTESKDARITKQGARIMKGIAGFYKNEDGTLKIDEMNEALHQAAGDNSVLNYQEARQLYAQLLQGKVDIDDVDGNDGNDGDEIDTDCEVVELAPEERATVTNEATDCHQIQVGDNWSAIVAAKYPTAKGDDHTALYRQIRHEYCEANGIPAEKENGFFPSVYKHNPDGTIVKDDEGKPVRNEICLKDKVEVNGKVFELNKDGVVKGKIGGTPRGRIFSGNIDRNPYATTTITTTFRAGTSCGDQVFTGSTQEEANRKAAESIKK